MQIQFKTIALITLIATAWTICSCEGGDEPYHDEVRSKISACNVEGGLWAHGECTSLPEESYSLTVEYKYAKTGYTRTLTFTGESNDMYHNNAGWHLRLKEINMKIRIDGEFTLYTPGDNEAGTLYIKKEYIDADDLEIEIEPDHYPNAYDVKESEISGNWTRETILDIDFDDESYYYCDIAYRGYYGHKIGLDFILTLERSDEFYGEGEPTKELYVKLQLDRGWRVRGSQCVY